VSLNSVSSHPRIFYGWLVVAAAFAVTFVGFGSAYTFSAFVGPLQKDFVASRAAVSFVFSLAGFLYFGFGIVSGPLADRWGSRRLAVIGMLLTGIGLAVGLGMAFGATQILSSLLYGITPTDATTFIAVAIVLCVVTVLACYLPARRAMRVDPIVALRYE